jgi:hypothetical protein
MEEKEFERVEWARKVLGLRQRTNIRSIKESYEQLTRKLRSGDESHKKLKQKIDEAFGIVAAYCENYEISFEKDALEKQRAFGSYGDWWLRQFGNDPIWGNPNRIKKEANK